MRRVLIAALVLIVPSAVAIVVFYLVAPRDVPTSRDAVGQVTTLAGTGAPGSDEGAAASASFSDPFGVAVDRRGNVFVADAGRNNSIRVITPDARVQTVAGGGGEGFADGLGAAAKFNTPSGLAFTKTGELIIADTSNNRIRRLLPDRSVSSLAGSGVAGFKDGPAAEAQFDGPIGVAADKDGNIIVADAYNDRIRKISRDGDVTTIAGTGLPGYGDGAAAAAAFDTPCGVAIDKAGDIFVADAGNHAVRKITPQGEVATIVAGDRLGDGRTVSIRLERPIAIAVTHDGFLFLADESAGRIVRISPELDVSIVAGAGAGFANGPGARARFNGLAGIAVDREGTLYAADAHNYMVRLVLLGPQGSPAAAASAEIAEEKFIQPAAEPPPENADAVIPRLSAELVGLPNPCRWPLLPTDQWHEVAGVVGEARGAAGGVALDHIHAGLDVRGNMGDPAVSILDEKVTTPLPTFNFGGSSEGIHIGVMSYIHVRVGRDGKDNIAAPDKFKPRLDPTGQLIGIRVRRGARFGLGDFIGSLNQLYHVHLNFGPWNAEANAIAFPFPGFKDTIPPVIEPDGVEVTNLAGERFTAHRAGRLVVSGDVRILLTAYDRVDGNVPSRKLGLYRAGYQVFTEAGAPAPGFEQPLINLEFNRLPPDPQSVLRVYADGSGVSAYGTPTKFRYILTNRVRDGEAREGFLRTAALSPGNYTLRIIAEDYAHNRASGKLTELPITIEK